MPRPQWQNVDPGQLDDDLKSWRSGVVYPLKRMQAELFAMLTNGLTFTDNMCASVIQFSAQHGTEALFTPPDKMKIPLTFIPIGATLANGTDVPIAAKSAINYQPKLSTGLPRNDGNLGITVQYAPPLGALVVQRAADQSIPTGVGTVVLFDTIRSQIGSGITLNTGTGIFTLASAGIVSAKMGLWWAANAAAKAAWFNVQATAQRYAENDTADPAFGNVMMNLASDDIVATAGMTISVPVTHFAGVAVNISRGGVDFRNFVSMRYVAPDPATIATVRGILVGA